MSRRRIGSVCCWEPDIKLHHRLTVSMPMGLLGIVDDVVSVVTLAYVQPTLAMAWGVRRTMRNQRRARAKA